MSAPGKAFHCASLRFGDLIKLPFKFLVAVLFIASASPLGAQNLQTIFSFSGTNGANPVAALTLGNDGNFYGTTKAGGSGNYGTIFQVTTNGTLTTLVTFNYYTNGAYPLAPLTLGNDGNFYGTTYAGGVYDDGTVFKMTTNGALTTLVSFKYTNGAFPEAALTLGNDGNFYGTTYAGGVYDDGTVFKMTTNGALTTLVSFNSTNEAFPEAALTLGNDRNFYGTTYAGGIGGIYGDGTVFKMTTNGALTTLVSFNYTNGAFPEASLTPGNNGIFYGTTWGGGMYEAPYGGATGTIFQVTTNGALICLYSFTGGNDGAGPNGLVQGSDGNFYGTTYAGGIYERGTIFQMTTNGTLTTLVRFNYNTNGAAPEAALDAGKRRQFLRNDI